MPTRPEVAYFGAGPASLPTEVLEQAAASLLNHLNTGLGIAEHSHRSGLANDVLTNTQTYLKQLLEVPEGYSVLFMQGGGTTQFSAVVYNLFSHFAKKVLTEEGGDVEKTKARLEKAKAEYVLTGGWSSKACAEAKRLVGEDKVKVIANGKNVNGGKWGDIPAVADWEIVKKEEGESVYTYYCDNETVDGVEFKDVPELPEGRYVVADMSSNILSRKVDVSKFAILYAGAQKNVGTAGLTILIIRDDILSTQCNDAELRQLGLPLPPIMLHYPTLTSNNSLYNTLPIFEVYICGLVMKRLLETGGLSAMQASAERKAGKIYDTLEKYENLFKVVPKKSVRSRMNICFRIEGEGLEGKFVKGGEERGLLGLKGHRSVGGIRISNYNSITEDQVDKLIAYIEEFVKSA